MLGTLFNDPLSFVFWAVGLVVAITIHEFAHAYAADRLGDPTPGLQGRISLNPLKHLDPLGTVMMLIVGFGWGKPVIFDPYNLRNPKRDSAIISFAGPLSNLILAVICSVILHINASLNLTNSATPLVIQVFVTLVHQLMFTNVVLAIFNLVPVHPLDGFKIVGGFLSDEQSRQWYELERYGFIFLMFLLLPIGGTSPMTRLISPVIQFLLSLLLPGGRLI